MSKADAGYPKKIPMVSTDIKSRREIIDHFISRPPLVPNVVKEPSAYKGSTVTPLCAPMNENSSTPVITKARYLPSLWDMTPTPPLSGRTGEPDLGTPFI